MSGSTRAWTADEDSQLRAWIEVNRDIGALARELHRTEAAVMARGYKLGLRFGKPKSLGLGAKRIEKSASE
jgi:hypothetical protein